MQWIKIYYHYFDAHVIPDLVSRCPCKWEYFGHVPIIFLALFFFLTFWYNKILQVHLVIFLLGLWNQPFLQGAQVPFSGKQSLKAKIQTSGVLAAVEVSLIPNPLERAWEYLAHVCVPAYMHYLYFYIYIDWNHEILPFQPDTAWFIVFVLFPFLIV